MQLLFCLCILRVLCGLCTVHPESFLPFQKNFSVSATSAVCADKERQRHFVSIFPDSGRTKKKPDFLTRLTHRVLRRRNLTSLLLPLARLSARKLQTISVPVLLIAGTRDLVKPSHSRWLARQIPTSRLLLMTGDGILPYSGHRRLICAQFWHFCAAAKVSSLFLLLRFPCSIHF